MMIVYTKMEYIDSTMSKETSGKIKYKIIYCKVNSGKCGACMV